MCVYTSVGCHMRCTVIHPVNDSVIRYMHATAICTSDGCLMCDCVTGNKSHTGWPPPTRSECIGDDGFAVPVCDPGGDLCGNLR